MCKSPTKLTKSDTLGCPVQRSAGVKPARSTSLKGTGYTPKLSPFSLKTHGAPDTVILPHTACGDLLPRYTPHINISSTCHRPGLWGGPLTELWSRFVRFIHFFAFNVMKQPSTSIEKSLHLCYHSKKTNLWFI